MKIQHFVALVVLSLATVRGARMAVRGFKARTLSLLTLACLLVAVPATAQVNYAVSGNTAYVGFSRSASGAIVIASTYNGYPVTSIVGRAFEGCAGLTSVAIPSSVTNIGSFAFRDCTSLTNISVDAANPAYSSLNGVLFDKAQTTLIVFPFGRSGSYVIPNTVTSIVTEAFYNCFGLTSVTIPNSVTSIGSYVFYYCSSLTSVTIPDSVTSILFRSFERCGGLTSVIIGNSVTNIADYLFWGCSSLANVTIGNSVASIGVGAFELCPSLAGVTIPNSVTSIGLGAFDSTGLTNMTIPNSVISIGSDVFYGCPSLTNVTIGNSVTSIEFRAFKLCTSLKRVTIPNSVTNIGQQAFSDCTGLTNVIIGNGVASIGFQAFYNCTSLTNLSVAAANPVYSSLDGVLFNKAQTTLIIFPPGRGGSYVIPDSVTSLGNPAFSGCTSVARVTIPNSITNIGVSAFSGCTSLTNVTIPNSVIGIGSGAFSNCTSLARVTIPNSVTSIGYEAFRRCTNLTNFTSLGNAPQLIFHPSNSFSGSWFVNVGAGAKAYYYCGTTGWGTNYGGLPTVMLCPPQIAPGSAGVKPGGFGFTLTFLTNQTIVVEASTNLPNWQPIWTNTPPGASTNFVDPEWLNHSNRFYRARSD